ncbi:MAG: TerB family tellurite resistance protein [Cytophagales bacterium]|nr:TerB family tellurite resistance protein [Bernardetiaceae bacterium]MDW8204414.1 TerB family tellurite resistance protein [Cytophagales bacterium]
MSFFKNLFSSAETKRRKSHIMNLLSVAAADGKITREEIDYLAYVAEKIYMPREEFIDVIKNPQDVIFYPPESNRERLDQLYDLVGMMMIDGHIDQDEIIRCKMFAQKLGFKSSVIDAIVAQIIDGFINHLAREAVFAQVMRML